MSNKKRRIYDSDILEHQLAKLDPATSTRLDDAINLVEWAIAENEDFGIDVPHQHVKGRCKAAAVDVWGEEWLVYWLISDDEVIFSAVRRAQP